MTNPQQINWRDYKHMLGKMSDARVAKIAGTSRATVQRARARMKIKPHITRNAGLSWDESMCKVGFSLPMDVIHRIDDNYKETGELRSHYIARLVREDMRRG